MQPQAANPTALPVSYSMKHLMPHSNLSPVDVYLTLIQGFHLKTGSAFSNFSTQLPRVNVDIKLHNHA
jgi:hypothetical protein